MTEVVVGVATVSWSPASRRVAGTGPGFFPMTVSNPVGQQELPGAVGVAEVEGFAEQNPAVGGGEKQHPGPPGDVHRLQDRRFGVLAQGQDGVVQCPDQLGGGHRRHGGDALVFGWHGHAVLHFRCPFGLSGLGNPSRMFVRPPVPPHEAGMVVIRAGVTLVHARSGCVVNHLGLEVVIQGTRAEELSYEPPARRHRRAGVGPPGWIGRVHITSLN